MKPQKWIQWEIDLIVANMNLTPSQLFQHLPRHSVPAIKTRQDHIAAGRGLTEVKTFMGRQPSILPPAQTMSDADIKKLYRRRKYDKYTMKAAV